MHEPVGQRVGRFNPRSPWGERRHGQSEWRCGDERFNPRSPWGERPDEDLRVVEAWLFQSTLPVGGATFETAADTTDASVSIHAPRGGSDDEVIDDLRALAEFQSTLPVGGATGEICRQT